MLLACEQQTHFRWSLLSLRKIFSGGREATTGNASAVRRLRCCLIDQNHIEFSRQTTLRALQTCRFRASSLQVNPYAKKKSKNISFPRCRDSQEARDLDQAQTSAMNSQICLF